MTSNTPQNGPLSGKRIIELAGIGPAPYCGQLLADLGADVILIDRPQGHRLPIENRGKRSIQLDLTQAGATEAVLKLVESADALIEGLRPGVTERLGIGPDSCQARNPKLVYGRMTGWGQTGPWSQMAGHDINYLSITGVLNAMGHADRPPTPPINVVGDYGGGSLFLALGVLAGIIQAEQSGKGDVVDAAIVDGVSSTMHVMRSLTALSRWGNNRQANLLDGGAPYYRCYQTKDNLFMAVGCIEPQFFAVMAEKLNLDLAEYGEQNDPRRWPAQHTTLETIFASETRNHWSSIFSGTDACVTPVLDYQEALKHPHNLARQSHVSQQKVEHPNRAPRFDSLNNQPELTIPQVGQHSSAIMAEVGYSDEEIQDLLDSKVLGDSQRR